MSDQMVSQDALEQIFLNARTHSSWTDKAVADELLHKIYDLMKYGPTSANSTPARIIFVKSPAAKERLVACMAPMNAEKTRLAPVSAILAMDMKFYEKMKILWPYSDLGSRFASNETLLKDTAFRNSSLQGGYFIVAARAVGLDCGPMSGFDPVKVNEAFFADSEWRVNFLCNLGYGDASKIHPRSPRLDFNDACKII